MLDIFTTYGFLKIALYTGILASILCGVIGTYIVVNKNVFISAGISHISFGGLGIAYYLNYPPFMGALLFSSISAIFLGLSSNKNSKQSDTSIGILWALGTAIGILFIHLTPGYSPDLMSYLFGNILIVSNTELYKMLIIVVLVASFFIVFYKEILVFSFDRDFAVVKGIHAACFNVIIYIFISFSIVSLIELVGIMLVMALLTIPPSIAVLFSSSFRNIIFLSIIISVVFVFIGLIWAYYTDIPSGVLITLPQGVLLFIIKGFKYFKGKRTSQPTT